MTNELQVGVFQRGIFYREVLEVAEVVRGGPGEQFTECRRGVLRLADRDLAADHDVQAGGRHAGGTKNPFGSGEFDLCLYSGLPGDMPHRAGDLDATADEDRDPVGETLRLVEVVGGEHDRFAKRAEVLDRRPAAAARLGVEAGRRLVEENQVRVAREGECQVQAAALPTGQAPDLRVLVLGQLDDLEQIR
jgi:hypothetical protein